MRESKTWSCLLPNRPGERFVEGAFDKSLNKPFDFEGLEGAPEVDLILRKATIVPEGAVLQFQEIKKETS